MLRTTSAYMAEHSAVWNSMAPLQTAMTEFDAELAHIGTDAQTHAEPNGATADKADARDALEDVTFLMSEALSVVAHNVNDNELGALTRLTRSTLKRMAEEELAQRSASLLARANAHKTELQPLQVTQANIDELGQALTEFNSSKTGPRTATAERSVLTESLPRRVKAATDILRNRVDPMVNLFSRIDPDFVAGYENARAIVDRAATHKAKAAPAAPATPATHP
jgi:hypothetical protein